jgi:hypothetical protein
VVLEWSRVLLSIDWKRIADDGEIIAEERAILCALVIGLRGIPSRQNLQQ